VLLLTLGGGGRKRLQQLFLAVDKGVGVVGGDFKIVAVGNGITGASFHTVAAENAPVVVNVVNLGVALRCADAVVAGILGSLNVNAVCRAGSRAEEAGDALFQTILVATQNMDATITTFKVYGLGGIILRNCRSDHHLKGRGESLRQRQRRIGHFPDNVWHSPSKSGRTAFGLGRTCLTPAHSIMDRMMAVKFTDNPATVTGRPIKTRVAA